MRKIANNDLLKQVFKKYFAEFGSDGYCNAKLSLAYLQANPDRKKRYGRVPLTKIDEYIQKIIDEYPDIILADQTKMRSLMGEFNQIISQEDINESFYSDIVLAMHYGELREKEFMEVVQELGIRTCVYCHAQLTVVIDTEFYKVNWSATNAKKGDVRVRRGLLELDHRHPKSKYPFLSTSFYNLYPTCGNCNRIKSSTESSFDLYSDTEKLDVFMFSLDKESMADCLSEKDKSKLKIDISWANINDQDAKAFLELFDIQEIYDTQKDIVEELVHKKVVYTDKYKEELHTEFLGLFEDQKMINRLIIGNYDQPGDIHKRPLAKFTQDIARDIELIPKLPKTE